MNRAGVLLVLVGLLLASGCAASSVEPADGGGWPIPSSGNAAAAALHRMPATLGEWERTDASRGMAFYGHPRGQLGIEASDLADLFADDVGAAEAVSRLTAELAPGTARSCSRPHYHCVTGESRGLGARIWGDDRSDVVLVAVWPDDEARALLARAWLETQR